MSTTTIPADSPIVAPPGTVCRRCWHGLKGLAYGSVCPECGESIGAGMDPLWWGNKPVETVARTARWLTCAVWLFPIGIGLQVAGSMLDGRGAPGASSSPLDSLATFLSVCGASVMLSGVWLAVGALLPPGFAPRWVAVTARCVALLAAFTSVVCAVLDPSSVSPSRLSQACQIVYGLSMLGSLLLWSVAARSAAKSIGVKSLRVWSLVQLSAACLLVLCWIPTVVFAIWVMTNNTMPSAWVMNALNYMGYVVLPLMLALATSLVVVPPLMRAELRRFVEARRSAL